MTMVDIKTEFEAAQKLHSNLIPSSFHPSFYLILNRLHRWIARLPEFIESSIINDLFLLYIVASKKFLDHRDSSHLFRLVLSIYAMQKKLLRTVTFSAHQ